MKNFKDYYTFPLQMDKNFTIKVFTKDHKMAFDWIVDISDKIKFEIINKLNTPNIKTTLKSGGFSYKDGYILKDEYKIILIRGWGMLTGCGAFNLPTDEALKIQNEFANYITNTLNT